MKGKKGDIVLPEFLKIILAIVVLVLLVYLAYQLYSILTKKTELEQARATLAQTIGKINELKENGNEGDKVDYIVTAPINWYLVSYNKEIVDKNPDYAMPKTCYGKDCLCMCPADKRGLEDVPVNIERMTPLPEERGGWPDYFYKNKDWLIGLKLCEEKGLCVNIENTIINRVIKYQVLGGPLDALLYDEQGPVNWISLLKLPKDITLTKKTDKVFIDKQQQNEK